MIELSSWSQYFSLGFYIVGIFFRPIPYFSLKKNIDLLTNWKEYFLNFSLFTISHGTQKSQPTIYRRSCNKIGNNLVAKSCLYIYIYIYIYIYLIHKCLNLFNVAFLGHNEIVCSHYVTEVTFYVTEVFLDVKLDWQHRWFM